MQGYLHEIDIRSILQMVEMGQRTGALYIETYRVSSAIQNPTVVSRFTLPQSWMIFFLNGQMIHATQSGKGIKCLEDHLQRYRLEVNAQSLTHHLLTPSIYIPEYCHLWTLLEQHLLTPVQARSIIQSLICEVLFDLLCIHQGRFRFELGSALTPQIMTLEISPMLSKIMKQIQGWKQLYPLIQSPDQQLAIGDLSVLKGQISDDALKILETWSNGTYSIRQIARYLNRNILAVARVLYPYIQSGALHVMLPPEPEFHGATSSETLRINAHPPHIVCLEHKAAIQETIEQVVNPEKYKITSLGNSLKALSRLFQLQPDLILCDFEMPELDGNEFCAMLRQISKFQTIPIIMLLNPDNEAAQFRARRAGADTCLIKPFSPGELVKLIDRYLCPNQLTPNLALHNTIPE